METDKDLEQLKLLFDYTKFHIGLYITVATIFSGLIASQNTLFNFNIPLLFTAVILIGVAGLAGGVIASSIPHFSGYKEFWRTPIGPIRWHPWKPEIWTYIEHCSFWLAVILAVASVGVGARSALLASFE